MFGISPKEYKQKWNLPAAYSLVFRNYTKDRSSIARKIGLGTKLITKLVLTPEKAEKQTQRLKKLEENRVGLTPKEAGLPSDAELEHSAVEQRQRLLQGQNFCELHCERCQQKQDDGMDCHFHYIHR